MDNYSLALAFDTGGSDFVRGVEIGRLWEMLKTEDGLEQTVHASNAEMVLRLGEATERPVCSEDLDDHWIVVRFGPAGSRFEQPVY